MAKVRKGPKNLAAEAASKTATKGIPNKRKPSSRKKGK